jgi:hypothetical protein
MWLLMRSKGTVVEVFPPVMAKSGGGGAGMWNIASCTGALNSTFSIVIY